MKKIITIFGFLLLITTTLYSPMTIAAGEKGWCTVTGRKPGGINGYNEACTDAPQSACKIQKDTHAPNAILGSYSSTGYWWKKKCDWTICRGLSPYQCGYIHPGSVDFKCNNEGVRLSSADYLIRVPPGACIKRSSYSAIPNFDTSSRVVFFPRVTVNSKKVYTNVKLVLKVDSTWTILAFKESVAKSNQDELIPNLNSLSNIVYFPRIIVDNNKTYNVDLLLNSNNTWSILRADPMQ